MPLRSLTIIKEFKIDIEIVEPQGLDEVFIYEIRKEITDDIDTSITGPGIIKKS